MQYLTDLNNFLSQFATEERLQTFHDVLDQRTRYLTVALENIYQPQNASAVIRTCDCFGLQDLHVIENDNKYNINPDVVLGSANWVDRFHYNAEENNTQEAIDALRAKGYSIVATTPHTNDVSLPEYDVTSGKAAFFFGTELTGLSDIVLNQADAFVKIPMYGFTESFNISVSAAIVLYQLTAKLRQSELPWQLTAQEREQVKLQWLLKSIKKSELLVKSFCQEHALPEDYFNA